MAFFKKKKKKKQEKEVTLVPPTEEIPRMRFNVANLQGIGARKRQEDSFTLANALDPALYDANGLMFCVCDGMGGMQDGKLASETAISSIRNSFSVLNKAGDIPLQMKNSIQTASALVYSALGGDGGSTAVMCVIISERLYYAGSGDSFLYIKRSGKLLRINGEHNVCNSRYLENIRDGEFDPTECKSDPEAPALTSFLGMPGEIDIDCLMRPLQLKRGDVILACSDGVGGVLSEAELLTAMNDASVAQMCQNIEQLIVAHARPNQDNYTALVVECV